MGGASEADDAGVRADPTRTGREAFARRVGGARCPTTSADTLRAMLFLAAAVASAVIYAVWVVWVPLLPSKAPFSKRFECDGELISEGERHVATTQYQSRG